MSKNKFNLTLPPVEPDPILTPSPVEAATKSNNLAAAISSAKSSLNQTSVVIPSVIDSGNTTMGHTTLEALQRQLQELDIDDLQRQRLQVFLLRSRKSGS